MKQKRLSASHMKGRGRSRRWSKGSFHRRTPASPFSAQADATFALTGMLATDKPRLPRVKGPIGQVIEGGPCVLRCPLDHESVRHPGTPASDGGGETSNPICSDRLEIVSPTFFIWIRRTRPLVEEIFAHPIPFKVQFPKVPRRTATAIVLLTVLLAGIITPTGVCALLCERHARAESQRHCSQLSHSMPGMAHDHAAMNHPSVEAMGAVLMSQSCQTNCVRAERLNVLRRVIPQVTVIQSGTVILDATAEFLRPDPAPAWSSDGGPPAPPPAHAASFSILRI